MTTDTPRTDAAEQINDDGCGFVWSDFVRELERENAKLRTLLPFLEQLVGPYGRQDQGGWRKELGERLDQLK